MKEAENRNRKILKYPGCSDLVTKYVNMSFEDTTFLFQIVVFHQGNKEFVDNVWFHGKMQSVYLMNNKIILKIVINRNVIEFKKVATPIFHPNSLKSSDNY